jgi:hypothetical protein
MVGLAMTKTHRPWYTVLYIQVPIAIAFGIWLVISGPIWAKLLSRSATEKGLKRGRREGSVNALGSGQSGHSNR